MMRFKKKPQKLNNLLKQLPNRSVPEVPDRRKAPDYKGHLFQALQYFGDTLGVSDDYRVRLLEVANRSVALLFLETICESAAVEDTLRAFNEHRYPKLKPEGTAKYLTEHVIPRATTTFADNLFELREAVTTGNLVVLIDGVAPAIVIGARFVAHRTPEPAFLESSVRGSQISFVENIGINIGLIRASLNSDTVHVKKFQVGYRSRRQVAVVYLGDVANPIAIEAVTKRIEAIHIDVISQSAAIEQRIIDHQWSPFPLMRATQRVDSVVREINQGKIVVIVDGDPTVLLAPASIQDFFQTEEDYAHTFYEGSIIRVLRVIAFVFALFLPALYIAFVDFNPELLPKVLGLQIAQSREGVPFPAVMEVLIMQIVVEILREATLRMPKQMGQTIGIVGGLVVGQASVEAGLVSNILIIVIALSAVSIFVTPSYEFATALRLGTWIMVVSATLFGLYGVILASVWGLYELSALKSFGISYLDPFSGEHIRDVFTDSFLRLPVSVMDKRTEHLHPQDPSGQTDYENPMPFPQLEKTRKRNRKVKQT